MTRARLVPLAVLFSLVVALLARHVLSQDPPTPELREKLRKTYQDGNFKDAYDGLRQMVLNPQNDPQQVGEDLKWAVRALNQLARVDEADAFIEEAVRVHATNWRLLWAAADCYMNEMPHHGFIVAGEFYRGNKRGGGRAVNALERDRVRALQLMRAALDHQAAAPAADRARFHLALANVLLNNRGWHESWRLQYKTDLSKLPDYGEGWYFGSPQRQAPVDEEGNPVFYDVAPDFDQAVNDGQRWRWALEQAAELDASLLNETLWQRANFLHHQFGVHTMAQYGWFFARFQPDDKDAVNAQYALHTLGEEETLAKLATGVKRFPLPDEHNHIKLLQSIAANPQTGHGEDALNLLAQIHENRRQYPRAAEYWQESINKYGAGNNHWKNQRRQQIVGNWGRFEMAQTQPAGQGASVEFRYRNARQVAFEAFPIDMEKLLADVKAYLKSNPGRLDWHKINLHDIGYRLVERNESQYLGEKVASWSMDLDPAPMHFDKQVTITTPLRQPGAYWLTAKVNGGNVSRVVMWVADSVLVRKPMENKTLYYVADAVTGTPIPRANVEFFGYKQVRVANNRFDVQVQNFSEFTDDNGLLMLDTTRQPRDFQWVIMARGKKRELAFLGFTHVWSGRYYDPEYNAVRALLITDRPVYRPQQRVEYKFWVRHAKYDQENTSDFAEQQFTVDLYNPRGEKVDTQVLKADAYGGIAASYELPEDAPLGVWRLTLPKPDNQGVFGSGTFRVEEYKKPEFEVTVEAPAEPVQLGETIKATIKANYYFGAPVTHATVKYKVTRTEHRQQFYPPMPWDWLFGPGYWWFAPDYAWYPGWAHWGCRAPLPRWFHRGHSPPEVVIDAEAEIREDGTVELEIDTALAKEIYGDQDHRYSITAEVMDQSRRTIVGTGSVIAAREPFKVVAWTSGGYFRVGDEIQANFLARTPDSKPVQGKGRLDLIQITYDAKGNPTEAVVQSWEDVNTNAEGRAQQSLKAAAAGQYRLAYHLTDTAGHTIEGGYLFNVIGQGFDGAEFRFNDLELIADRAEYAPGQQAQLMINTNRVGGTVLVFERPVNGVYLPPKVLRLQGKSAVHALEITKRDMPNTYVEVLTVAGGNTYTQARELVVPPEERVVNVLVEASSQTYRPGERAQVTVKVTDLQGNPFVGALVASVYDKSVEYISGGSNVPDIKEFFWSWRRNHHPQTDASSERRAGNSTKSTETPMQNVGVFGHLVAWDAVDDAAGEAAALGGKGAQQMERARGLEMQNGQFAAPMAAAADGVALGMDRANNRSELRKAGGADKDASGIGGGAGGGGDGGFAEPQLRKNFADTAYWAAALVTNEQGLAQFEVDMPENLTTWKIQAWAMGHGTKVGSGAAEVITRKNLILRMQTPRFVVQKDEVVLTANVHNYLKNAKSVDVVLELEGDTLAAFTAPKTTVEIAAGGEARVDWRVRVLEEGMAVVRMKALSDEESDAMEMRFPVFVHGIDKMVPLAGVIRPDEPGAAFTLDVPAQRRISQTRWELRYSPSLAGAVVDAVPYLVSYPYETTDATLHRFLPTVIAQKVLLDLGVDLAVVRDKRTNLNAQEIGDPQRRAGGWKRYPDVNPVFDEEEVARMAKAGLQRLTEMQLSDGGWGWFSGYWERSDPHTTALVVHGLQVAVANDLPVVPGVLERGVQWLTQYQNMQVQLLNNAATKTRPYKEHADHVDAFVFMVLTDAGVNNPAMLEFLYRDRVKLAVYAKAMYGLALHKLQEAEKLDMILQNIRQYLEQDDENQTAWLRVPEFGWWFWWGSEAESNAYYLRLLSRVNPQDPVASRLVKYLLNNRKHATYWSSTRDTAICIESIVEYMKASGEDKPDLTIEVLLDGQKVKEVQITPENLFTFDDRVVVEGDALDAGVHDVEIRRRGKGPVYFNSYLSYFTLEDPITKAGLEIKVQRKYYRLVKDKDATTKSAGARGQAVDQRVEKYLREPLDNLAQVKPGELVEIELEIDSKNDYEYLVFEDMKAAGFEPADVRSGYVSDSLPAYRELRDEKVVFFVRWLARGKHSVSYRMRAEVPGMFHALPTQGYAMYAPELRCNADEIVLIVEE